MRAALLISCGSPLRSGSIQIFGLLFALVCHAEDRLATVRSGLQQLAIDRTQTYRVRELELSEGGAKFYFSEGVLAFATPLEGYRIAALFTTSHSESGDAEVIALPPIPAERASLARFTKTPNLDEHFSSALLFFSNTTADELLRQIRQHPVHPAPELADELGVRFNESLRKSAAEIEVRIAQSILDRHTADDGFFYGMVAGRTLGTIDFIYQPKEPDTLVFGRIAHRPKEDGEAQDDYFQIWSAFRASNVKEAAPLYQISDYQVDSTIQPDLSMTATANFDYQADADDGRVISLSMTPHLRVTSAQIDGKAAGVLMHDSVRDADMQGAVSFLLVHSGELTPGSHHHVRIQYTGTVIQRALDGSYFVSDRNTWYPVTAPMRTTFDLRFRCPGHLRLVATGELISEEVVGDERRVHCRTAKPEAVAGFNLGEFEITSTEHAPYRIRICSNPQSAASPNLDEQAARILQYYSERWVPLTAHDMAIAPIEGYFGQGFPGLIYLSSMSYRQAKDRPSPLRTASFDSFFSRLLLPHELAHQWWGNVVSPADYHSNWIVEAMANYSALQYLDQANGRKAMDEILAEYRADLDRVRADGELVDSYGPVTFDQRLENNFGLRVWHDVLYEKGTWILHMLRLRMGDQNFRAFQSQVLKDFSTRPITNEDLRMAAARFLPSNQPDRSLTLFFDTWVYGTGIPSLALHGRDLTLDGVPDSFVLDVPLSCPGSATRWLRVEPGETALPDLRCSLPAVTNFLYKQQ